MFAVLGSLLAAFVLAPIVSCATGFITLGHDSSQVGTIGDISFSGFPIWFHETAPGFSLVDGWHSGRFALNTLFWVVVIASIFFVAVKIFQAKR